MMSLEKGYLAEQLEAKRALTQKVGELSAVQSFGSPSIPKRHCEWLSLDYLLVMLENFLIEKKYDILLSP